MPFLDRVELFLAAALGCFLFNFLSWHRGRVPALSVLSALKIKLERWVVIFGDISISSFLGAAAVLIILRPDSAREACEGGLVIIAILSAYGHSQ